MNNNKDSFEQLNFIVFCCFVSDGISIKCIDWLYCDFLNFQFEMSVYDVCVCMSVFI